MQLKTRLPRALLCVIFAIALFAGIGTGHAMSGSLAVLIIHLLFAVMPDNMCCQNDGVCIETPHYACAADDIANNVSVTGIMMAIFGTLHSAVPTEPVVLFCATFVTIGVATVLPTPPLRQGPDMVLPDEEDA